MPSFFHLYGLILGLAIAVGYWLVDWLIKKEKIKINVDLLAIIAIVCGLVGARVYHLVTDWQMYGGHRWWDYLAIWNGGVGVIGALIGGGVGLLIGLTYLQKKSELFKILDILALAIPLSQSIGRWGNYVNHELFGLPTTLPWGIFIPQQFRPEEYLKFTHFHPLFLYESIFMFGVFCVLQGIYRKRTWHVGSKKYIGAYFMLYAILRFVLEFLRVETARSGGVFSVISVAQWMMIILWLFGISLFFQKNNIYSTMKTNNRL